jgi:hypothetical protein
VGDRAVEATVLNNLGVTSEKLHQYSPVLASYEQALWGPWRDCVGAGRSPSPPPSPRGRGRRHSQPHPSHLW